MPDLTPAAPTHFLDQADVCCWLTEHGFDPDLAIRATVIVGGRGSQITAHVEVEHYLPGPEGQRIAIDPTNPDRARTAVTVVPLHDWPPLRPTPPA